MRCVGSIWDGFFDFGFVTVLRMDYSVVGVAEGIFSGLLCYYIASCSAVFVATRMLKSSAFDIVSNSFGLIGVDNDFSLRIYAVIAVFVVEFSLCSVICRLSFHCNMIIIWWCRKILKMLTFYELRTRFKLYQFYFILSFYIYVNPNPRIYLLEHCIRTQNHYRNCLGLFRSPKKNRPEFEIRRLSS